MRGEIAVKEAWHGKPYYSVDAFFKNTYGEKIYKIAVDAGLTCPNRDGTIDSRGCSFCSAGGSGDFAVQMYKELRDTSVYGKQYERGTPVSLQIAQGIARFNKKVGERFRKGEKLGEIRDYFGRSLFVEYAPDDGVLLHQCASLNIIEKGPMVTYGVPTV